MGVRKNGDHYIRLAAALASSSTNFLARMKPQELSNVIYALGQLREKPSDAWMAAFYSASLRLLKLRVFADRFTPRQLANIIFSLALLEKKPSAEWMDAYWIAACHSMSTSNQQDLSNTIWAAATLDIPPPASWMELFKIESRGRLSACISQDLANMMWSFAKLRHRPSNEWLQTFVDTSLAQLHKFNAQELSNTIWSFAELGIEPTPGWTAAWEKHKMAFLDTLNEQDIANSLWALVVLQKYQSPVFLPLWSRSQQLLTPASDVRCLRNIYCVYKASAAEMPGLLPEPSAAIFDAARDAWRNNTADRAKQDASNNAAAVTACLREMGIAHECEYLCSASERSMDIALRDRRIAIEVDGPYHFFRNVPMRTGATRLRDRLLEWAGWTVVSVPFFEFDELRTKDAQTDYIQGKVLACK